MHMGQMQPRGHYQQGGVPEHQWLIFRRWSMVRNGQLEINMKGQRYNDETIDQWCRWAREDRLENSRGLVKDDAGWVMARVVDFSENMVGDQGFLNLLQTFHDLKIGVRVLKMYKNLLGRGAACAMASWIGECPIALHELHFSHNFVPNEGFGRILDAIAKQRAYPPRLSSGYAPLWFRVEYNLMNAAAEFLDLAEKNMFQARVAMAVQGGPELNRAICIINTRDQGPCNNTHCGKSPPGSCPLVHLTYPMRQNAPTSQIPLPARRWDTSNDHAAEAKRWRLAPRPERPMHAPAQQEQQQQQQRQQSPPQPPLPPGPPPSSGPAATQQQQQQPTQPPQVAQASQASQAQAPQSSQEQQQQQPQEQPVEQPQQPTPVGESHQPPEEREASDSERWLQQPKQQEAQDELPSQSSIAVPPLQSPPQAAELAPPPPLPEHCPWHAAPKAKPPPPKPPQPQPPQPREDTAPPQEAAPVAAVAEQKEQQQQQAPPPQAAPAPAAAAAQPAVSSPPPPALVEPGAAPAPGGAAGVPPPLPPPIQAASPQERIGRKQPAQI